MIAIRGAITVKNNSRDEILEATKVMLKEIIEANRLNQEDLIAITFTMTKDLDAVYPAVAARELCITEAALLCMQELYIKGSLMKCIRVLVQAESSLKQKEAQHIYLRDAVCLRPDLKK